MSQIDADALVNLPITVRALTTSEIHFDFDQPVAGWTPAMQVRNQNGSLVLTVPESAFAVSGSRVTVRHTWPDAPGRWVYDLRLTGPSATARPAGGTFTIEPATTK